MYNLREDQLMEDMEKIQTDYNIIISSKWLSNRHQKLSLPAYDQCLKASHVFNILDARGAISVAQRAEFIARIRDLTKGVGQVWVDSQK